MREKIKKLNEKLGSEISMKMEFDSIYRKYVMAFYNKEELFFKAMGACACQSMEKELLEDFDEELLFNIEINYKEKFNTK